MNAYHRPIALRRVAPPKGGFTKVAEFKGAVGGKEMIEVAVVAFVEITDTIAVTMNRVCIARGVRDQAVAVCRRAKGKESLSRLRALARCGSWG